MEHYLIYGLAAVVIFMLLMSIGPRIAKPTNAGNSNLLSPTSKNGFSNSLDSDGL